MNIDFISLLCGVLLSAGLLQTVYAYRRRKKNDGWNRNYKQTRDDCIRWALSVPAIVQADTGKEIDHLIEEADELRQAYDDRDRAGMKEEIGDCLIMLHWIAYRLGINTPDAIEYSLEKNRGRNYELTPDGYARHVETITTKSYRVVLCGPFRNVDDFRRQYQSLKNAGYEILSPITTDIDSEKDGFIFLKGDSGQSPGIIERKHLAAIKGADFVWVYAPDGYVGTSVAFEIGYAHLAGIPIYSSDKPDDKMLQSFVKIISEPVQAKELLRETIK